MSLENELQTKALQMVTRRHFLRQCSTGLGTMALGCLLDPDIAAGSAVQSLEDNPLAMRTPHFPPTAKHVIFLHMSGGPSQLELFDHKPALGRLDGQDCPDSLLEGVRFAFIEGVPKMLAPQFKFRQHGKSGLWISERLPHFSGIADEVTVINSMVTDEFNHAPAQFLMHTGFARLGQPSMGSWITYGLGSENQNLPGYVVLVSGGKVPSAGKSVWGSGFLPTVYQGVQCRSQGEPILYASDPDGINRDVRRRSIDAINNLNRIRHEEVGDPEILTRISQYELAFRMQMSVPEAVDISQEPESILEMYGAKPGQVAFANNCLLARRLVERGVRFVQLYDWGWDSHGTAKNDDLHRSFVDQCRNIDQSMTALVLDLKQRGLLDETLIVWGGEFGRTPMRENQAGMEEDAIGRDHHPFAFSMWMAGGGARKGYSHGKTDELGYHPVKNKVHIHDLQATILHLLGFDHEKLTYQFQGRDFRLTDVHGNLVPKLLA